MTSLGYYYKLDHLSFFRLNHWTSNMAASNMAKILKPRKTYVVGVGMTKFEKPGRRANFDYPDMVLESGTLALNDAGISYSEIQHAFAGFVFGESTSGQRALYGLGLTGIPVYNVNNNCSTGSTALMLARHLISGGLAECVMAVGFEKMQSGSLAVGAEERTSPMDKHVSGMLQLAEKGTGPMTAQMFGNAAREHMERYGTTADHFAKVAYKNHKHSVQNDLSQFMEYYSLEDIKNSQMFHYPLTKLQCCPTSDGSAAAILMSEEAVEKHNLQGQAVEILGQSMATDMPSTFEEKSRMKLCGYDLTKKAAEECFKEAGLTPEDVQVVELHDCFSSNELISYEALGLCEEGKAGEFIDKGDNTYGGKYVVNPCGGLISKGHPLGATGLAQCAELCWHLRGIAEGRQVPGAKVGLQHNLGLGGAAVVTLYRMGFPEHAESSSEGK